MTITPAIKARLIRQALHALEAYDSPNIGVGFVQGHVRYHREENVLEVAVAGTNDEIDILSDFQFFGGDTMGGVKIHRGVYEHAKTIEMKIIQKIRELNIMGAPTVELSGHSLGGGALFPLCIRTPWFKDRKCSAVAFNAPRVFKLGGQGLWLDQGVQTDMLRVNMRGDLVSGLPPAIAGFRHIGEELVIGSGWNMQFDHPLKYVIAELRKLPVV